VKAITFVVASVLSVSTVMKLSLATSALVGATAVSAFQPTSFFSSSSSLRQSRASPLNAVAIDPTSTVVSPLKTDNGEIDLSGIALSVSQGTSSWNDFP
jgi:hypothetical protein